MPSCRKLVIGRAPFARPVGSHIEASRHNSAMMDQHFWRGRNGAWSLQKAALYWPKACAGVAGRTMEFSTGFGWTRLPLLAAVFILGSALTVSAQIIPPTAAAPDDEA